MRCTSSLCCVQASTLQLTTATVHVCACIRILFLTKGEEEEEEGANTLFRTTHPTNKTLNRDLSLDKRGSLLTLAARIGHPAHWTGPNAICPPPSRSPSPSTVRPIGLLLFSPFSHLARASCRKCLLLRRSEQTEISSGMRHAAIVRARHKLSIAPS